MKTLHEANFAKRLLAVIMDAALAIFIMFGFASLVFTPIANKAFHYSDKMASGTRYQIATKLYLYYDLDDNKNPIIYDISDLNKASSNASIMMLTNYESDDIEFYRSRLKYYYLNYKTGQNIETPESGKVEDYRAPNYEELIDGKSPSELYTEEWFNSNYGEISDIETMKNAVLDATKDFYYSSYFIKLNKDIKKIQVFIIMPSFVIAFSIFFIVIPLCFKNGETLAKKFLHIGFVTKDGYRVLKRQIVLRQSVLLVYVFLCSFIIGVGLTSFATLGVGVFIYFLATFISKTKRSPVDYLSYVYLVDTVKSVYFKDEYEEQEKEEKLAENMKQYHENTLNDEDKHIIQVGGEIVNEDLKKEIEEEK